MYDHSHIYLSPALDYELLRGKDMFYSSVESQNCTQSQVYMNIYTGMNGWMMYEQGHEQAEVRQLRMGQVRVGALPPERHSGLHSTKPDSRGRPLSDLTEAGSSEYM